MNTGRVKRGWSELSSLLLNLVRFASQLELAGYWVWKSIKFMGFIDFVGVGFIRPVQAEITQHRGETKKSVVYKST